MGKRVFRFFTREIEKQFHFDNVPKIKATDRKGYIWYRVRISVWDGGIAYRLDNFIHDEYGTVFVKEAYPFDLYRDEISYSKRYISHHMKQMMEDILEGLKKELTKE